MSNMGIEIVRRISAIIAAVLGIAWNGLAETVMNVRGLQRENSKLVDIYYDINDSDGGTYYVEVEIVGRTSDVNASSFSGDVGEGVAPGQNRHIVWEAGADWRGNKGDVKAVVTATIEPKKGKPKKVQLWEGGPYWADRNIGADEPWECGLYFWWGDIVGYKCENGSCVASDGTSSDFWFSSSNTPTFGKGWSTLQSEGWITADYTLMLRHDAAHVHWGGGWRMPTETELNELGNKCDWTWMTRNGVNGYLVRGRGNYTASNIFLPCSGKCFGVRIDYACLQGYYWASKPDLGSTSLAYALIFYSDRIVTGNYYYRYCGLSIRPVQ